MERSGDPVEAALDERRARQAAERRLQTGLTLADRGRDAAERRLRVRAFLVGGTTVAGTALAADGETMTIERARVGDSLGHVHVAIAALIRLTVADAAARFRAPHSVGAAPHGIARAVAELARRNSDVAVTTSDGLVVTGSVVALSEATIGIATGALDAGLDGGVGPTGASIDWVDTAQIVAVVGIG